MELGSKLNAVDIREGDDVYFECTIDAFPSAERISWKKDVSRTHYSLYFSTKKLAPSRLKIPKKSVTLFIDFTIFRSKKTF